MTDVPAVDRIHSVEVQPGWSLGDNKVWKLVTVRYRVPGQRKLEKLHFRGETWEEAARGFGLALDRNWPNVELAAGLGVSPSEKTG